VDDTAIRHRRSHGVSGRHGRFAERTHGPLALVHTDLGNRTPP